MTTGNTELDAIVEQISADRQKQLLPGDANRLGLIERAVQRGLDELQRARQQLEELARKVERRGRSGAGVEQG
ncbi:MAG: hypothetical protein GY719_28900 [bacterium]|nr:hypothetical protein [bacterium]